MPSPDIAVGTFYSCSEIHEQHCFIKRLLQSVQAATSGIQIPVYVGAHTQWRFWGPMLSATGGASQSFAINSSPEDVTLLRTKMVVKSSYPFMKIHEKSCCVNWTVPGILAATSSMKDFLCIGAYKKGEFQDPVLSAFGGSNQSSATNSSSRGHKTPKEDSGWIAQYICRLTLFAPFDRVKLLLQSQSEMIKSGQLSKPYKGIFDCFNRTMRTDGFFSLWRGHAIKLATLLSYEAVRYSTSLWTNSVFSYDQNKERCLTWFSGFLAGFAVTSAGTNLLYSSDQKKEGYLKWFAGFLTGSSVASAVIISFVHPLFYAHTRWASDVRNDFGKRQFSSLRNVFKRTIRSEGIVGLYRGLSVSISHSCLTVVLCTMVNVYMRPDQMVRGLGMQHKAYAWPALVKGLELCVMLATYPLDTIGRRMMMTCGQATRYESAAEAFSKIVKKESFRSLYKGAGAWSLKIVLESALMFVVIHEWLKQAQARQRKKLHIDGARTAVQKNTTRGDNTALQKKTEDGNKTYVRIRFKFKL